MSMYHVIKFTISFFSSSTSSSHLLTISCFLTIILLIRIGVSTIAEIFSRKQTKDQRSRANATMRNAGISPRNMPHVIRKHLVFAEVMAEEVKSASVA